MEELYAASASFLTSSMLQVNGDKTHAMLITTAQFRRLNNLNLSVNFGNDLQTNSKVESAFLVYICMKTQNLENIYRTRPRQSVPNSWCKI